MSISGGLPPDCLAAVTRASGLSSAAPGVPADGTLPVTPAIPAALAIDGEAGSVTGSQRPVVATVTPSLTAVFASRTTIEATFEHRALSETDSVYSDAFAESGPVATLTFDPGDLSPGESYRWRVRGDGGDVDAPGWSAWCEFTVDPGAPDLGLVVDGSLDALETLGLRPERR